MAQIRLQSSRCFPSWWVVLSNKGERSPFRLYLGHFVFSCFWAERLFRVTCVRHFWVLTRRRGNGCSATVSGARANASRLSKHQQYTLRLCDLRVLTSPPPGSGLSWAWRLCLALGLSGPSLLFSVFLPPLFLLVRSVLGSS